MTLYTKNNDDIYELSAIKMCMSHKITDGFAVPCFTLVIWYFHESVIVLHSILFFIVD